MYNEIESTSMPKKNIAKYLYEAGFIHIFKDIDIPATESFVKEIDGVELEIEFLNYNGDDLVKFFVETISR